MVRQHQIVLSGELASVPQARRFARQAVIEWGVEGLADDIQLGISELVTNAVRHAGTDLAITLQLKDTLLVEVRDQDPELRHPAVPTTDPLATSGRGLQIVAAVSADWGVRGVPGGKIVWFELALPDEARRDADVHEISDRREVHERAAHEKSQRNASPGGRFETDAGERAAR